MTAFPPLLTGDAAHDARPFLIAGDRCWTRRDAGAAVAARVAWLRAHRSGAGGLVAVDAAGTADTIWWVVACIEAGIPFLPLHPRWTAAERDAVLADAGAPPLLPALDDVAAAFADAETPRPCDPEAPLAVVYTSGTSGRPKGVELSRRAFRAAAIASRANVGHRDDDRWLLTLPPAHVGGLSIVTRALCDGSAIVLYDAPRFDEARVVDLCAAHAVTLVSLVPTMLHRLLERGLCMPPSVRAVLLGGAAASPALLRTAADAGVPVLTTYGLTEACSQVSTQRPGTINRGELGAGPPLPGVEVRLRGDRIQVRGQTLCTGYWPRGAHATPFDADGFYDTGDEGTLDAGGNLHVLGRRSDLIVVGGENVRPAEVEAAALDVAGVAEACVFGVPDAEWGERVALLLVAAAGCRLDPTQVVAATASRLARFKRPTLAAVVPSLPAIGIGKIDRRRAAADYTAALRPIAPPR